jgi:dipeptidyl aminopeptidase/acylaminoacyl peptidase
MKNKILLLLLVVTAWQATMYADNCDNQVWQECFNPGDQQKLCQAEANANNALDLMYQTNSLIDLINTDEAATISILELINQVTLQTALGQTNLDDIYSVIDQTIGVLIASTTDSVASNQIIISTLDVLQSIDDTLLLPQSTTINEKVKELNTSIHTISLDLIGCAATPLFAPTTITVPGNYVLCNTIAGNVTIAADDVQLDMAGFSIINGSGTALSIGAHKRIYIFNGIATGDTGIDISGAQEIKICDMQVCDCITTGIIATSAKQLVLDHCNVSDALTGLQLQDSTCCTLQKCSFTANQEAVLCTNVTNSAFQECTATNATLGGYSFVASTNNCIRGSTVTTVGNSAIMSNTYGFMSSNGSGNVFEQCSLQGIVTGATADGVYATGFLLTGSESCSKIIDCTCSNNSTSSLGQATPYGILLTPVADTLTTVTQTAFSTTATVSAFAAAWSPDSRYLAVGGERSGSGTSTDPYVTLRIYYFDTVLNTLTLVSTQDHGAAIYAVQWSDDQRFLAIGGDRNSNLCNTTATHRVYMFNQYSNQLVEVAHADFGATVYSVAWNHLGSSIAVGGQPNAGKSIAIYSFNPYSMQLVLATTADHGAAVRSVDWSADDAYLAIAGDISAIDANTHRVYSFVPSPAALTVSASANFGANLNAIAWANEGINNYCYLAVGGQTNGGSIQAAVYSFTPSPAALVQTTATANPGATVYSVSWASNYNYLALSGESSAGITTRTYLFSRAATAALTQLASATNDATVTSVSWSPDGRMLASVNDITTDNQEIRIQRALSFPQNNIITGNIIFCSNSGASCPRGVGISGSSIANVITHNLVYNAASPYQFVPNIFDGTADGTPSPLQNVYFASQDPVVSQSNPFALAQSCAGYSSILEATVTAMVPKANDIATQTDIPVQTILDNAISIADAIMPLTPSPCNSTLIATATTINSAGTYCLANTITGSIVINQNNVVLDLNGYRIQNGTNGVVVNSGMSWVTIQNGIIGPVTADALQINSNCVGITLKDLQARNSTYGAHIISSNHVTIQECDFSQNSTGLLAINSWQLSADMCTFQRNINAGLSLVSSSSNVITNCVALENGITGTGSTYGFISSNGTANSFQKCIVEGTTTTTTNFNAVVAGFALTNSEMCSSIIGCESGNNWGPTALSASAPTVNVSPNPTGILLKGTLSSALTTSITQPITPVTSSAAWSPGGKYLAISGNATSIFIYRFDFITATLSLITTTSLPVGATGAGNISWSPNGKYLSVLIGPVIALYTFTNEVLTNVSNTTTSFTADQRDLQWSPNGKFIAISGAKPTNNATISVYALNAVNNSLTLVADAPSSVSNITALVTRWSPDSQFLATGFYINGDDVTIYQFSSSPAQLTASVALSLAGWVYALDWSPDGQYLAIGQTNPAQIYIYKFNPTPTPSATQVVSINPASGTSGELRTMMWSQDGKYLAITHSNNPNYYLAIYTFDRNTPSLNLVLSTSLTGPPITALPSLAWSPDGQYLANSRENSAFVDVYKVLSFPSNNIIKDNITWCNRAGTATQPYGVGISGSSIANLIMNNLSYNNLFNYNFVTIPFTQLLSGNGIPSPLQNISAIYNQPITNPDNAYQELLDLKSLYCTMNSKLDWILSHT